MQSQPAPLKGFVSYNKCSLLNESCVFVLLGIYVPPRDLQSPYPATPMETLLGTTAQACVKRGQQMGSALKI